MFCQRSCFPSFLCCLMSTPPHVHALYHNHGSKYDLCNPFRPHDPLFIVISFTHSAHRRRWTPGHYQASITTIPIKSDMRANYIFVKSKWMSDPQWPLPGQPCCSRNWKRLCALLALGNLNNSLRCVHAIGPATCVRAVYLTVCIEEIRMWIRDKRFRGEAWGAERANPGSTICPRMTSPAKETWDVQGGRVGSRFDFYRFERKWWTWILRFGPPVCHYRLKRKPVLNCLKHLSWE